MTELSESKPLSPSETRTSQENKITEYRERALENIDRLLEKAFKGIDGM